jgi:DNA polymerase-3 subunit alpha
MQAQRERFVQGAVANGISEKRATKIFDLMEHFAGYGFNKSHSTAYAYLAYQTAYLKANYPWHFAAALLTIEAQNTDKLALYLGECRERGIPVLPPDVNGSELRFTVTPDGVRFGLTAVKNVGEYAILSILEHRRECGGFRSLQELCEGVDLRVVNKRVLESLVKAGAVDSLVAARRGDHPLPTRLLRPRLLAAVDAAIEHGNRVQRDRDRGQADLFGQGDEAGEAALEEITPTLPNAPGWTEIEQLSYEKEALGLFWSGHPIDSHAADLREYGARTIAELLPGEVGAGGSTETATPRRLPRSGEEVTVGGIVTGVRPLKTRKGERMGVFTLEDRDGGLEVVVYTEPFARFERLLEDGALVVVRGRVETDDEESRLYASDIAPISSVRERLARELAITLAVPPHGRQTFEALAALFDRHRGDKPVTLQLELRGSGRPLRVHAQVSSQIRVKPSPAFLSAIRELCGDGAVVLR